MRNTNKTVIAAGASIVAGFGATVTIDNNMK